MGRKPDAIRRAELLSAFTEYILENGLADLSLRPAAAALRTSPQVLLYHFRSKEQLLVEAIAQVRARQEAEFARNLRPGKRGEQQRSRRLRDVWRWYSAERHMRYLRLFYEVYGLAIRDPKRFRGFLELIGRDHRMFLEAGLIREGLAPGQRTSALATFYFAAFRGLTLDLLTTGERSRIDAGVAELDRNLARTLRDRSKVKVKEKRASPRSPARSRRASPPARSGRPSR